MKAFDLLEDEDGDLAIDAVAGDLVIGLSDKQHIRDIIVSFIGYWKQFPQIGVGIDSYVSSSGKQQEIQRLAQLQLQGDGYDVKTIVAIQEPDGNFNLKIDAQR